MTRMSLYPTLSKLLTSQSWKNMMKRFKGFLFQKVKITKSKLWGSPGPLSSPKCSPAVLDPAAAYKGAERGRQAAVVGGWSTGADPVGSNPLCLEAHTATASAERDEANTWDPPEHSLLKRYTRHVTAQRTIIIKYVKWWSSPEHYLSTLQRCLETLTSGAWHLQWRLKDSHSAGKPMTQGLQSQSSEWLIFDCI